MISNAFRYNADLIRANGTPFFTGDGSTSSATLLDRHGNPISSDKLQRVDAIHRTDWQGRQLLYPVPRTNLCLQSDNPSAASWQFFNVSGTASVAGNTVNFGNNSIDRILCDRSTITAGMYTASVTLYGTGKIRLYIISGDGSSGAPLIITLNATPTRYTYQRVLTAGPNGEFGIYNYDLSAGLPSFTMHYAQFESGEVATSYIATTTAARTVTDYTLSGSDVTFGETPLSGAACDWTGVARR